MARKPLPVLLQQDIVPQLRAATDCDWVGRFPLPMRDLTERAADEIERLRAALQQIAENRDEPYAADTARDTLRDPRNSRPRNLEP